ncbi:MAG: ABC transporter substrate-binding protein [Beutenbergiaceae bacterium]
MRTRQPRRWGAVASLVAGAMILVGCGSGTTADSDASDQSTVESQSSADAADSDTRVLVDLAGREVTVPADVSRVAALVHPMFEAIIMLQAWDQVVVSGTQMGVSGWTPTFAPQYGEIPIIENASEPNIEELVAMDVEVVLFWDSRPEVIAQLEEAGMAVVVTQVSNGDGIDTAEEFVEFKKQEIMLLGELFGGQALERAQQWADYVDETVAEIATVTDELSDEQRPSVYYVRGPESLTIHGGESYTRYLVDIAGGALVSREDPELLYETTMEQVLNWDPEYIFMGRVNNVELITEDPAWASVQAVSAGNIFINLKAMGPTDYSTTAFLLMQQIATQMHPDLFGDIDMAQEVQEYFSTFYDYELSDDQTQAILTYDEPSSE